MQVAIYTRVSTQEQAEHGYSISEQADRLSRYCEAMNWDVYRIYTDAGFSGSTTNRPALQELIKDAGEKRFGLVLVYKLDRLSRSQLDTLSLIEKTFLGNGIEFVSMQEHFDTSTPFGRAMVGILAVFAQLEREQITERMRLGQHARAKAGKFKDSYHIPWGFIGTDENGYLIPNEYERAQVVEAFHLSASGLTPARIASLFKEKGYTRRVGRWDDTNIRHALRNRVYCGYIKYNDRWYKAEHEPFISEELFDTVQNVLARQKEDYESRHIRAGKAKVPLAGFMYCGVCGCKFTLQTNKTKLKDGTVRYIPYCACCSPARVGHSCGNKFHRYPDIEAEVFSQIKSLALDDFAEPQPVVNDNRPAAIRAEISSVDSQLSRLIDLYAVSGISESMLQKKLADMNDKKIKLQQELERINDIAQHTADRSEAVKTAATFEDVLTRGDFHEIRAVLSALIDKVVIDRDQLTIYWRFS